MPVNGQKKLDLIKTMTTGAMMTSPVVQAAVIGKKMGMLAGKRMKASMQPPKPKRPPRPTYAKLRREMFSEE